MRNILLFVLIICLAACNKKDFCFIPDTMTVGMNFKTYDTTNKLVDTFLVNPSVYNTDTTYDFALNKESLNNVSIALSRLVNQQTYIVIQSGFSDTLILSYTAEENFISNGCGYQTYFQLKAVSHSRNSIDSVNIINAAVNPNSLSNHLEIIYK